MVQAEYCFCERSNHRTNDPFLKYRTSAYKLYDCSKTNKCEEICSIEEEMDLALDPERYEKYYTYVHVCLSDEVERMLNKFSGPVYGG